MLKKEAGNKQNQDSV